VAHILLRFQGALNLYTLIIYKHKKAAIFAHGKITALY